MHPHRLSKSVMLRYQIEHIPVLQSTNEYMQKLIENKDYAEGLVITTDYQEKGKGHGNNTWESQKGQNLLFSLLLKPSFIEPSGQFALTECISLALVRSLKKIIPEKTITIKWPNDIYIDNMKVGGILIQNTIRGNEIANTIAGIGLNVSQLTFPSELPNPISIRQVTGHEHNRDEVLQTILREIGEIYSRMPEAGYHKLMRSDYHENLYRFKEWSQFRDTGVFRAMITGVDRFGQLQLMKESGEIFSYGYKEIEYVI